MGRARRILAAAAVAGMLAAAWAHVRLQTMAGGDLWWQTPSSIGIVINSAGSDDIPDGSHETALRNAIEAWNQDAGTTARLVENTSPAQQARTDYSASNIHLILFDEDNDSGYFVDPSTVALTPVWFFTPSGRISDADVLFNGQDHEFTTEGTVGRFDVQDVATHELGHLLGFDHSGWAGATMYPYVDPTIVLHRSLGLDDVHALRDAYPASVHGQITGTVRRLADNTPVAGANLFARDSAGRTAGGALSETDGTFAIRGLDAETYMVGVSPLDFPVAAGNLGAGHVVHTDFESRIAGPFAVAASQTVAIGDLFVDADVGVSLGRNLDVLPQRCPTGVQSFHVLRGAGLVNGSALAASDPALTVTVDSWGGTDVHFRVDVPPGAAPGHADLQAIDPSGDVSILPAALEITPEDPRILTVTPGQGTDLGGTAVTIEADTFLGGGFSPGSRVVIGPRIYVDGEPGGCTVVDSDTITLTTAATPEAICDVVVIDPTGVEGRETNGFQFLGVPVIDTLFPSAGDAAGGTTVRIRGQNFQGGVVVRIDGVQQASVTLDSSTRLSVTTQAGVPGGPYVVEVENPGGAIATAAFAYVAAPDPVVASLDPDAGSTAGGQTVQVLGSGFTASMEVVFGADADTGLGGTSAASVTFVDAATLEVVTPAHASGAQDVLVRSTTTGQAVVALDAFAFASSGGGGGGCSVGSPAPPPGRWDGLASGWWLAVVLLAVWWSALTKQRALRSN